MGDLISRRAAINALCAVCGKACDKSEFVYNAPQDEQVILCPEHYCLCTLPPAQPGWIPCSRKLPEMHDAGILKKVGIKQISKMVYITIEEKGNDGSVERITDADAELRDGEWYSNTLRWLKAAGKKIEVTAWMPYPEPYRPEGDDKHGAD